MTPATEGEAVAFGCLQEAGVRGKGHIVSRSDAHRLEGEFPEPLALGWGEIRAMVNP